MSSLSVIIPIYSQDSASQFAEALDSVLGQTRVPDEIVIVGDGPVPAELEATVQSLKFKVQSQSQPLPNGKGNWPEIVYLPQEKNGGLGEAMRIAVEMAKGDYIARMDADDICLPDRFEKQLKCFENDADLGVIGGQIADFDGDLQHVTGRRVVPCRHESIVRFMKSRNGMNHVTVMMRKSDLLKAGNYQSLSWFEDYHLWVRMIMSGSRLMNLPDTLVMVRAGKGQIDRRGGWNYFRHEVRLFKYMYSIGFISCWRFLLNCGERCCVRLLMPLSMRGWFYKRFLREQ